MADPIPTADEAFGPPSPPTAKQKLLKPRFSLHGDQMTPKQSASDLLGLPPVEAELMRAAILLEWLQDNKELVRRSPLTLVLIEGAMDKIFIAMRAVEIAKGYDRTIDQICAGIARGDA